MIANRIIDVVVEHPKVFYLDLSALTELTPNYSSIKRKSYLASINITLINYNNENPLFI